MTADTLNFVHHYVRARDEGKAYVYLLLHGTGGNEHDMIPIGEALAPGSALLSPRGQVIENGMPRFFRRLADGVFDVADIVRRAQHLSDFVKASSAEYGFDPAKVIPVGFSNGANIAAAMLLLHAEAHPAAVLFRPMVPLRPDEPGDLSKTAIYVGAAKQDPMAPMTMTQELICLFKEAGAHVSAHFVEGGHGLTQPEIQHAHRWLVARNLA